MKFVERNEYLYYTFYNTQLSVLKKLGSLNLLSSACSALATQVGEALLGASRCRNRLCSTERVDAGLAHELVYARDGCHVIWEAHTALSNNDSTSSKSKLLKPLCE